MLETVALFMLLLSLRLNSFLQDGHTHFFSATQSIVDAIPNIDSVSESPKTSPSAELHPFATDEPSTTSSSPHHPHGDEGVRSAPEKSPPPGRYDLLPQDVSKKGAKHQSPLQTNLSSVSEDISKAEHHAVTKTGGRMDYKVILDPNAKMKEGRREYHEMTAAQVESKVLPSNLEKHLSSLDNLQSEAGTVSTRGRKYKHRDVASAAQEAFESAALAAAAAQEVVKLAKRDSRNGANNGMVISDSSDSEEELHNVKATGNEKIAHAARNGSELIGHRQKHTDDSTDTRHGSEDHMDCHPQFSHNVDDWHSCSTVRSSIERSSDTNLEAEQISASKWQHDLSSVCSSFGTIPEEQSDPHAFTGPKFDDDNNKVAQSSFYKWNREDTLRSSGSFEVTKDQTGPRFDDNFSDNAIDDGFIVTASTDNAQDDHFKSTDCISSRAQKQSILLTQDEVSPAVQGFVDNNSEPGYGRKSRSKAVLSPAEKTEVDRNVFERNSQFPDVDRYLEPDIVAENKYSVKAPVKCSNQTEGIPVRAAQSINTANFSRLHFSLDKDRSCGAEGFRRLKWHSRSSEDSDSSQFSRAAPQPANNVEIGTNNTIWHNTTTMHSKWKHSDTDMSPVVKDKSYHGNSRRSARSVRSQQRREHTSSRKEGEDFSSQIPPSVLETAEVNDLEFSIVSQSKQSSCRTPIVTPATLDQSERNSSNAFLLSKSSSVSSTSDSSLQPSPSSKLPTVTSPTMVTSFAQVSLASHSLEEDLSSKTSSMEVEKQQESSKDGTISSSTSKITPTMHLPDDDEFTARFEALRRKR
eukprot:c29087_g1_i2 orf=294-2708(+)